MEVKQVAVAKLWKLVFQKILKQTIGFSFIAYIFDSLVHSTTVNSSTSKFRFFVQTNQGVGLRVHFNIGRQ